MQCHTHVGCPIRCWCFTGSYC